MTSITIRKYSWQGLFRYAWKGEMRTRERDYLVVHALWEGPGEPAVGNITFNRGDHFMEYYYPGRCYAIWQTERPDATVKGWYCNISTPVEQTVDGLSFNDLLLDVLVYPDGRYTVLDRDEFEAARKAGLSDEHAQQAEVALRELLTLIHGGAPPFTFAPGVARAIES